MSWDIIISAALKIIDKVIPDPAQKAAAQLAVMQLQQTGELKQLEAETSIALAQIDVNKIEAASPSFFKSGGRPAVIWICAGGLFYQFMGRPFITWLSENWLHATPPPALDMNTLLPLLFSLLGLGSLRTFEKYKGVS